MNFILLQEKNGTDLGYSYYSKETYTLKGEGFVQKVAEILTLKDEDYAAGYAEKSGRPEAQQLPEEPLESKNTLKRLDGGDKISLVYKCGPLEL